MRAVPVQRPGDVLAELQVVAAKSTVGAGRLDDVGGGEMPRAQSGCRRVDLLSTAAGNSGAVMA